MIRSPLQERRPTPPSFRRWYLSCLSPDGLTHGQASAEITKEWAGLGEQPYVELDPHLSDPQPALYTDRRYETGDAVGCDGNSYWVFNLTSPATESDLNVKVSGNSVSVLQCRVRDLQTEFAVKVLTSTAAFSTATPGAIPAVVAPTVRPTVSVKQNPCMPDVVAFTSWGTYGANAFSMTEDAFGGDPTLLRLYTPAALAAGATKVLDVAVASHAMAIATDMGVFVTADGGVWTKATGLPDGTLPAYPIVTRLQSLRSCDRLKTASGAPSPWNDIVIAWADATGDRYNTGATYSASPPPLYISKLSIANGNKSTGRLPHPRHRNCGHRRLLLCLGDLSRLH